MIQPLHNHTKFRNILIKLYFTDIKSVDNHQLMSNSSAQTPISYAWVSQSEATLVKASPVEIGPTQTALASSAPVGCG